MNAQEILSHIRQADQQNFERMIGLSTVRQQTKGPAQMQEVIDSMREEHQQNVTDFKDIMSLFDKYMEKMEP